MSQFSNPLPGLGGVAPMVQPKQDTKQPAFDLAPDANLPLLSVGSEWIGAWAARQLDGISGADYDYRMSYTELDELTKGIDQRYWHNFAGAASRKHAEIIREQLIGTQESRRLLADAGWQGSALRIAANIFDPVQVAGAMATGGLSYVGTGSRVAKMVRLGLVGGAVQGGLEAYRYTQDDDATIAGVLSAAAGGAGLEVGQFATAGQGFVKRFLGGAAGAAAGPAVVDVGRMAVGDTSLNELLYTAALNAAVGGGVTAALGRKMAKQIELESLLEVGADGRVRFSDKAKAYFAELDEANTTLSADAMHNPADILDEPSPIAESAEPSTNIRTIGAASQAQLTKGPTDLDLSPAANGSKSVTPRILGIPLRFGMAYRLGQSALSVVRDASAMLAEDVLYRESPSGRVVPNSLSASEWKRRTINQDLAEWESVASKSFADWRKANGKPAVDPTGRTNSEFFEEVGKAVRRERGTYTNDPHVNAVADQFRNLMLIVGERAQRHNVKGFRDLDINDIKADTYFTRLYNRPKIDRFIDEHGKDAMVDVVAQSLVKGTPNLNPAMARDLAENALDRILRIDDAAAADIKMFLDDTAAVEAVLNNPQYGLNRQQIDDILYKIGKKDDAGKSPRVRRRMTIDETHNGTVTDKAGRSVNYAIEDFLENNAGTVLQTYIHQVNGLSATAEFHRALGDAYGKTINNFEDVRQAANSQARKIDPDWNNAKQNRLDDELAALEVLYKSAAGIPLNGNNKFYASLRTLRDANFLASMGQVGFAQIAETGVSLSEAGLGNMIRSMPELGKMIGLVKSGQAPTELMEELSSLIAIGNKALTDKVYARFAEYDVGADVVGAFGTVGDNALSKAKRTINFANGMYQIMRMQQLTAAAAMVNKWHRYGMSGRLPIAKRLASMGLTEAQATKILSQIKKHATFDTGFLGERVRKINIENWDKDAAASFLTAMHKWTNRVIQENDIGQMGMWMTHPLAKVFLQFRSYALVAWEKQLLYGVAMHDAAAYRGFATTTLFGALSYMAMTYYNAASLRGEERQKFLESRLNTKQLAAAAFQRSGWSSILPIAGDVGLKGMDMDPVFSNARTTGVEFDPLLGNPTFSAIRSIYEIPAAITAPFNPYNDITKADFNALRKLMPFQNTIGIKQALDVMGGALPDQEPK